MEQLDFFQAPKPKEVPAVLNTALLLLEDSSSHYKPRTEVNVKAADVTLAIAVDMDSLGEILTRKLAKKFSKYFPIQLTSPGELNVENTARNLAEFLRKENCQILNIAGNGIYSLSPKGYSQAEINQLVFDILKRTQELTNNQIQAIRSGGQTGADHAGLVAGVALKLHTTGYYPKGFKRRTIQGVDNYYSIFLLEKEIKQDASNLI